MDANGSFGINGDGFRSAKPMLTPATDCLLVGSAAQSPADPQSVADVHLHERQVDRAGREFDRLHHVIGRIERTRSGSMADSAARATLTAEHPHNFT